jgi:hypothetical protein
LVKGTRALAARKVIKLLAAANRSDYQGFCKGQIISNVNDGVVTLSIRFQGRPLFASNLDPSWMKELAYQGSA